jgi:hypothetical protein
MKSIWTSGDGARKRVAELLEQAGVPLELQVAGVCNDFIVAHAQQEDFAPTSQRIVYSPSEHDGEYREIDQCLKIYREVSVNQNTYFPVYFQYPIECKYRKDTEFFAFPSADEHLQRRFPVYSYMLKGSSLFDSFTELFDIYELPTSSLVALRIDGGETPQKVHDENLIYNAAGALYDFIQSDLIVESNNRAASWRSQKANKIMDDMELLPVLQKHLRSGYYGVRSFLDREITDEHCTEFNKLFHGDDPFSFEAIKMNLPIVCVNGPIYSVAWEHPIGIGEFQEMKYCLTSIRKRGWPGEIYSGLLNEGPEVPVIVTNPDNLMHVLELGYEWLDDLNSALIGASASTLKRWLLEASIYQRASEFAVADGTQFGYR